MRVRIFFCALLLLGMADIAAAETIPLPRPRPPELKPALDAGNPAEKPGEGDEEKKPEAAEAKPPGPPPPSACFVRLQEQAVIRALPAISKPGGCIAADVVQLEAVLLADKRQVAMEPPATFRCGMAQAITDWVRDEVAPATNAQLGSPLRAVENYASYDCRGRNNVRGAILSEHGKANALDIRSLKLVNGSSAMLTDANVSKEFRDGLRKGACALFHTVLGPGSDGYHEDHIHVDLAERKNDYRLCQWDVRLPIYRAWPSPHISSVGRPHVAGLSLPPAPLAVPAKTEDKTPRAPAPRKL
jgi:hypothetical protein